MLNSSTSRQRDRRAWSAWRAKPVTARTARAEAWVDVGADIAALLRRSGGVAKGNVLETARLAGIMAAKRTSELIPMCHPLALDAVEVDATLVETGSGWRLACPAKARPAWRWKP